MVMLRKESQNFIDRLALKPLSTEDMPSTRSRPEWEDIITWWDEAVTAEGCRPIVAIDKTLSPAGGRVFHDYELRNVFATAVLADTAGAASPR
jgi:hypothetical protein